MARTERSWSRERVLAVLWFVGSVLATATLLLPYAVPIDEDARAAIALMALLTAVALYLAPPLPDWALHAVLVVGTGAVTVCTVVGVPDVEGVMFLLPVVYAFATFRPRSALPHLLLASAAFAGVLALGDHDPVLAPGVVWLLVMGVGGAVSFAIARMVELREAERQAGRRDRRIAETLQRALLPGRLPTPATMDLAASYLPAELDAAIGGDLYGALELPDGRVAITIGDVAGKGLPVAAEVGRLRAAWRAYAIEDPDPASLIRRLEAFYAAEPPIDAMTTLITAVLDPAAATVSWATAGHLPPLHLRAGGGASFLQTRVCPPLGAGVGAGGPCRTAEATLEPGDALLLYTDGLVERRDRDLDDGLERLRAAVAGEPGDAAAIIAAALRLVPEPRGDDVALVAVRLAPVPAAPSPAAAPLGGTAA